MKDKSLKSSKYGKSSLELSPVSGSATFSPSMVTFQSSTGLIIGSFVVGTSSCAGVDPTNLILQFSNKRKLTSFSDGHIDNMKVECYSGRWFCFKFNLFCFDRISSFYWTQFDQFVRNYSLKMKIFRFTLVITCSPATKPPKMYNISWYTIILCIARVISWVPSTVSRFERKFDRLILNKSLSFSPAALIPPWMYRKFSSE